MILSSAMTASSPSSSSPQSRSSYWPRPRFIMNELWSCRAHVLQPQCVGNVAAAMCVYVASRHLFLLTRKTGKKPRETMDAAIVAGVRSLSEVWWEHAMCIRGR